jgi:predicted CXXCH cytochrome family protein
MLASGPDLCLTCHKSLKDRFAAEKSHGPVKSDCFTCHAPHLSKQKSLAVMPVTELCNQCHDLKKASFTNGHLGIDPNAMTCLNCHDPHASKDPKFFKDKVHAPFAGRTCDECHIVGIK